MSSEVLADINEPAANEIADGEAKSAPDPVGRRVERARDRLASLRQRVDVDPFVSPVMLLALEMGQGTAEEVDATSSVEPMLQRLTRESVEDHARRVRGYLGELDGMANEARLRVLFRRLTEGAAGVTLPFDEFRPKVERTCYGFVATAHPTFSFAHALQVDMVALALETDPGRRDALLDRLEASPHRPDAKLDLQYEHERSVEALRRLRVAIARAHAILFEVASEVYPDRWRELAPRLLNCATWVGFDTDGRSDITWNATYTKRLEGKLEQLRHIRDFTSDLRKKHGSAASSLPLLELLDARLALAIRTTGEQQALLHDLTKDPDDAAKLGRFARAMIDSRGDALNDSSKLAELVDRALAASENQPLARDLAVLKAEIEGHGLALARVHLRINSLQLHNAIRKQVGLDHAPDDPSFRSSYLEAIAALVEDARPSAFHFGDLQGERATARRVMMTAGQMLKLLDRAEPIRFLIAESETAFTLLTALYLAKLVGVDKQIDISPLFETAKALERGPSIMDDALNVPAYRDYIRGRGRLCIQAGYSDAGRYLGQLAAAEAIERLRLGMAEVMAKHGLQDVEFVIFDTHGESIGRGGHPASLVDRLRYYNTAEAKRRFKKGGISLCQESSFQGGDGYLWFQADATSFAVVTRVLEQMLEPVDEEEAEDPFYAEDVYRDEFFSAIRQFNDRVVADPCYATLLSCFGTNLLYKTGSRATKRQFDGGNLRPGLDHPSQIRAIPHNAILQQLGILANTIGGLGQAVAKDPERFLRLYRESDRFRRLMMMVEHAFKFTDLSVTRAYLRLFDSDWWLTRASIERVPERQEELIKVSQMIEKIDVSDRLMRIFRVFERDHLALSEALRAHRRLSRSSGAEPIAVDPNTRDNIHILHAQRLALIERTMRRAVHVPDFSDRSVMTHEGLVAGIMQLEIEPSLKLLGEIFPLLEASSDHQDYGEYSAWSNGGGQSYAQEHETIFRPLLREYDLIRRVGSALVHHLGAIG